MPTKEDQLLAAVRANDVTTLHQLLSEGVNIKADSRCFLAIKEAAGAGFIEIVNILLDAGADIEARNSYGFTPLLSAVEHNHIDTVNLLLARGADVNAYSRKGDATLILAQTPEMVTTLLTAGALVDAITLNGAPALFFHAGQFSNTEQSRFQIVSLLLDAGANVNARDADGYSALMIAAQHAECFEIVKILLARGADKELVNRDDTAISLAHKSGHPEIACFIENFNTFQYRLNKIEFDESSLGLADKEIFASLRDPITLEIMNDPIAVSSGIAYDRVSLQRWFESKKDPITKEIPVTIECPITKLLIHRSELHNRTQVFIKSAINSFVSKLEAAFQNPSRSHENMAHVSTIGIFAHTQQVPPADDAIASRSNPSSLGTMDSGHGSKK